MRLIIALVIISSLVNTIFCEPFNTPEENDSNLFKRNVNEKHYSLFNWDRSSRNWIDSYLTDLGKLRKREVNIVEPISTTEFYPFKYVDSHSTKNNYDNTIHRVYFPKPENTEKLNEKKANSEYSDSEYDISYYDDDDDEHDDDCYAESSSQEASDSKSLDIERTSMREGNKKNKRSNNLKKHFYDSKRDHRKRDVNSRSEKHRVDKVNPKQTTKNVNSPNRTLVKNNKQLEKNSKLGRNKSSSLNKDKYNTSEVKYPYKVKENVRKGVERNPQQSRKINYKHQDGSHSRHRRDLSEFSKRKNKKFNPKELNKKEAIQSKEKLVKKL